MEELICNFCKITFYRHKHRRAKYCSNNCSILARKRKVINDFSILSYESSYWAGFMFGDGCVSENGNIRLILGNKKHAKKHIEKFANFLFGHIEYINTYKHQNHIQVANIEILHNLEKYGIIPNKTHYGILKLPENFKYDFIRGFFDADGWATLGQYKHKTNNKTYYKPLVGMCSYNLKNLEIIQDALNQLGRITKKNRQHLYELRLQSQKDIQQFYNLCYGQPCYSFKWDKICSMPFLIK